MKKKRILLICVCLLGAMLYGSQALHRWLLPKVVTVTAAQGNIIRTHNVLSQTFISETAPRVDSFPIKAIEPLSEVTHPLRVNAGDMLARYAAEDIDVELKRAEQSYAEAEEKWQHYQNDFANAQTSAAERYEKAQKDYDRYSNRNNSSQFIAASREFNQAQVEYDLLIKQGIYQATTPRLVEAKRNEALKELTQLQELQSKNCQISSPVSGTAVPTEDGWVILEDGMPWQIEVCFSSEVNPGEIQLPVLIDEKGQSYRLSLEKAYRGNDNNTCLVGAVSNVSPDRMTAEYVQFQVHTDGVLVPAAALVRKDLVYVIETRWDNYVPQYYIRRQAVSSEPGDQKNVIITKGLSSGTKIAVGWDREFSEGEEVMISGLE